MQKRIAYITDIHLGEQTPKNLHVNAEVNWRRILEDVLQEGISDIVFGGDIGEVQQLNLFFESLKRFSFNLTLGNHDNFARVAPYFPDKAVGEQALYYRYADTYYTYLFLDSSTEVVSEEQIAWLRNELQTDKTILLFIHHPVLAIDTPMDKKYPLKNREAVQQCLSASGKPIAVFCGHYHMQDERIVNAIHQYVTPAASFQIEKFADALVMDGGEFGYRIIELDKGSIDTRVKMFKS